MSMRLAFGLVALCMTVIVAAGPGWAAPELGLPTLVPQIVPPVPPGTFTSVTVFIPIQDPTLIAGSAVVQRLNTLGKVMATIGSLHDDGRSGDHVRGDGIWTAQVPISEPQPTEVVLRVSAAFRGSLLRIESYPAIVMVNPEAATGVPHATADDNAVTFRNPQGLVVSTIPLQHSEEILNTPDGSVSRSTDEEAIVSPDQTRVGIVTGIAELALNEPGGAEAVLTESRFRYFGPTVQLWSVTAPPQKPFWVPTGSQLLSMHGTRVLLLLGDPTAESDQGLRVYNETGTIVYELPAERFATIIAANISVDGRYLLVNGLLAGQANALHRVFQGINVDTGASANVPFVLSDEAALAIDSAPDGRFRITLNGVQTVVP